MKIELYLAVPAVLVLGILAACHHSGGSAANPGGVFNDDEPTLVDVCHVSPDPAAEPATLTISLAELPQHLAHGDTEGPCEATTPGGDDPPAGDDDDDDGATYQM